MLAKPAIVNKAATTANRTITQRYLRPVGPHRPGRAQNDPAHEVPAGRAFHVESGHAPEALEDTEMVEFSPES